MDMLLNKTNFYGLRSNKLYQHWRRFIALPELKFMTGFFTYRST